MENIKLERCESPNAEDRIESSHEAGSYQPPSSTVDKVKTELEDTSYFNTLESSSSDSKNYHSSDSKNLKQFIEDKNRMWDKVDIVQSEADDIVSEYNVKFECDRKIEEYPCDISECVIEDSKTINQPLIDEGRICKSEDGTLTQKCVKLEPNKDIFMEHTDHSSPAQENISLECHTHNVHQSKTDHHTDSVHLSKQDQNRKCHLCNFSTVRKCNLTRHINSIHLKTKIYKCDQCKYTSSEKNKVNLHVESVHLKVKNYKCHKCNYRSSRKFHMQEHIDSVHMKEKNHKCHMCDYTSSLKRSLKHHIDCVHLKIRNYKCDSCDHSASSKANLQYHINSVHLKLKNYKCHMCDYSTSRNMYLQLHINGVHLKQKNVECPFCDFTTFRKYNLKYHIDRVHSKSKDPKSP